MRALAVIASPDCHCIPGLSLHPRIVIAGLTRNPVSAWHWIPDQVRDDSREVLGDSREVQGGSREVRDDKGWSSPAGFVIANHFFVIASAAKQSINIRSRTCQCLPD